VGEWEKKEILNCPVEHLTRSPRKAKDGEEECCEELLTRRIADSKEGGISCVEKYQQCNVKAQLERTCGVGESGMTPDGQEGGGGGVHPTLGRKRKQIVLEAK